MSVYKSGSYWIATQGGVVVALASSLVELKALLASMM